MLPQMKYITYDEFVNIDKNTDELLEYIDGIVYNQASPSQIHQTVALNIATEFNIFFRNKECKLFIAPFDVILKNENEEGFYEQFGVYKNKEEFESAIFEGLKINLGEILES